MIDQYGYRFNVGIILLNHDNQVFWGRRRGEDSWQFPQGGISENEDNDEAMYRELNEELGLFPEHVQIIAKTQNWLYYDVPSAYNRSYQKTNYRGQKQIWYLLKLVGKDYNINVKLHKKPEFDAWRWVEYWFPVNQVISFKQNVYREALEQLSKYLSYNNADKEMDNRMIGHNNKIKNINNNLYRQGLDSGI